MPHTKEPGVEPKRVPNSPSPKRRGQGIEDQETRSGPQRRANISQKRGEANGTPGRHARLCSSLCPSLQASRSSKTRRRRICDKCTPWGAYASGRPNLRVHRPSDLALPEHPEDEPLQIQPVINNSGCGQRPRHNRRLKWPVAAAHLSAVDSPVFNQICKAEYRVYYQRQRVHQVISMELVHGARVGRKAKLTTAIPAVSVVK